MNVIHEWGIVTNGKRLTMSGAGPRKQDVEIIYPGEKARRVVTMTLADYKRLKAPK